MNAKFDFKELGDHQTHRLEGGSFVDAVRVLFQAALLSCPVRSNVEGDVKHLYHQNSNPPLLLMWPNKGNHHLDHDHSFQKSVGFATVSCIFTEI